MFRCSVVIPCHNAARYLGAALRSAAAQTLAPHEVILVNDASTDDSVNVARHSGVDVKLLHCEHRHAGLARNDGIRAATGDWIAFLDADDLWYPDHLARAATLLAPGSDVGFLAYHHFLEGDDQVRDIHEDLRPKVDRPSPGLASARFVELMTRGFHFGHSTELVRRDRVLAVGGFDAAQKRRHDFDLWLRVIADHTWTYDTHPHAQYRLDTPGSISKNLAEAECYFLRAMLKNRQAYDGPALRSLIAVASRRAMSLSLVDGTPPTFRWATELAWPHLSTSFRFAYRMVGLCPPLARAAIRVKRRLVMGRR